MPDRMRGAERLLPLKPKVFHMLLAMAEGPTHGYAMMQDVRERSGGAVRLWPTGLYGALRALEKLGLIAESKHRPHPEADDERRRYFELTPFGRQVLDAEVARLQDVLNQALALRAPRKPRRA
jgi:DNA-binding PadR family transcriptional regulator